LRRVTRGHFASPTTDDALLWTDGCFNQGMTYLVSRRSGKWVLVSEHTENTSRCHKVRLDGGHDALVCSWNWYWTEGIDYHITYNDFELDDHHELHTYSGDQEQELGFISGIEFQNRQGKPSEMSVILGGAGWKKLSIQGSRIEFSWTGSAFERIAHPK
jgi:hypothetical protein